MTRILRLPPLAEALRQRRPDAVCRVRGQWGYACARYAQAKYRHFLRSLLTRCLLSIITSESRDRAFVYMAYHV